MASPPLDDDDEVKSFGYVLDSIFDQVSTSALQSVEADGDPEKSYDYIKDRNRARANKAHQENELRGRFFWWFSGLATLTIVSNFAIFVVYAVCKKGGVPDAVMIAWIGATVVDVLGIVLIMAQYLFPRAK